MKLMQILAILIAISSAGAMDIYSDFSRFYIKNKTPYKNLISQLTLFQSEHFQKKAVWSEDETPDPRPENPSLWLKTILGIDRLDSMRSGKAIRVCEISQKIQDGFVRQTFIIEDPLLGEFKVLILRPSRVTDDAPILVANHGHGGTSDSFANRDIIGELATKNLIIVVPEYRAMRNDFEIKLSKSLFQGDIFLMGVRIIECLLSIDLAAKLFPGTRKLAMIGHSGGSMTSLLASWILGKVEACIIDYQADFKLAWNNFCCEGIPPLQNALTWLYSPQPIFSLKSFPYNFVPEEEELIQFIQAALSLEGTNQRVGPSKWKTPTLIQISQRAAKKFLEIDPEKGLPLFTAEIEKKIIQDWKKIDLAIEKDTYLLQYLSQTRLNSSSDQPRALYPLLLTPEAKLQFISQFGSAKSLSRDSETSDRLQKLLEAYTLGPERNMFILNALTRLPGDLSPDSIVELFKEWRPSSKDLSVSEFEKILKISFFILFNSDSVKQALKLIPLSNEYKVIIGSYWYQTILKKNLRTELKRELLDLCSQIPKNPILPTDLFKALVIDEFEISSIIEEFEPLSEEGIKYLLFIGRLLIMQGHSTKAAAISNLISEPKAKLGYLDSLASEFEAEEANPSSLKMGPLLTTLLANLKKVAPHQPHLASFISSLLRFHGLAGNDKDFEIWFQKRFQSFFDVQGNSVGDQEEIMALFNLGVEFNKYELIKRTLPHIVDRGLREHIINEVFTNAIERKNDRFCSALLTVGMEPDLKKELGRKFEILEEEQLSIGQKIGEELDYYITRYHAENLNSDLIFDSLHGNEGRLLKDLISKKLHQLFAQIPKPSNTGKRWYTIFFSLLKIAKKIQAHELYTDISNYFEKQLVNKWPSPSNDLVDEWVTELINNKDTARAQRLVDLITSKKLRLKNQIHIAAIEGNLSEKKAMQIFEELEKHRLIGDQIDLALQLLQVHGSSDSMMQIYLDKLLKLQEQLAGDGKTLLSLEIAFALMDHHFTYEAQLILREALNAPLPKNLKNRLDFLYKSFSLSCQLEFRQSAQSSLKKLLQNLRSDPQDSNSMLILAGLLSELDEDSFPISESLVESLKNFWVEYLKVNGSSCTRNLLEEDEQPTTNLESILNLCGLED